MEVSELKEAIHHYIDKNADDRFLKLVYGMIQAEIDESQYEIPDEVKALLEERIELYKSNPSNSSPWDDVKQRIVKGLKR